MATREGSDNYPPQVEKRLSIISASTLFRRVAHRISSLPISQELLESHWTERLRLRLYRTSASDVRTVGAALERAQIQWWIAGGWGIDLLIGEQTRPHHDLDVWVEAADRGEERATAALENLGYEVTAKRAESGRRFPIRSVLRSPSGRVIDLIMVTLQGEPGYPQLAEADTATGTLELDGERHTFPTASATQQVSAHLGYKPQAHDRQDMHLLCAAAGIDLPPAYQRIQASHPEGLLHDVRRAVSEALSRIRGTSTLLFLIPEAQTVFDAVGNGTPGGISAHITVLYPFIPPYRITSATIKAIAGVIEPVEPFSVSAPAMGHHETTTFLNVEPSLGVTELTARIFDRWPEHPPYGLANQDIPPHITLADEMLPDELAETVDPHLPIAIELHELVLMTRRWSGQWKVRERFPLRLPAD